MSRKPAENIVPDLKDARALLADGQFEDALANLRKTLGRKPVPALVGAAAPLLRKLARAAQSAGDLTIATAAMELAVKHAPSYADLRLQYALVLLAHQQKREARRELEKALELNADYTAARVELALLDAREGLIGESLASLRELEQSQLVEEPATFRQGLESLQHADWDEAGSLLRRGLRLTDPVLDDVFESFHGAMDDGDPVRAASLVRDVLPRFEGYPDLHFLLGSAELRSGHLDDAIAAFSRALELNPDFHVARIELARALEALGQVSQARDQLSLVLEACPDEPQALELHARWASRRRRPQAPVVSARKDS